MKKQTKLNNLTCPYCGNRLTQDNISIEHVIGRRFVTKKSLENQWNLILNACKDCNNAKADLEDDISSITLINKENQSYSTEEKEYLRRKINNSLSRRTGKKISESKEEINANFLGLNFKMSVGMICNPQIDFDRASLLAQLQLMAFVYNINYDNILKFGHHWTGEYKALFSSFESDWGNNIFLEFLTQTKDWNDYFFKLTAHDYYKCRIKQFYNKNCFSWIIEWNKSYRIIGFFGDKELYEPIINTIILKEDKGKCIKNTEEEKIYLRKEKRISNNQDLFFI